VGQQDDPRSKFQQDDTGGVSDTGSSSDTGDTGEVPVAAVAEFGVGDPTYEVFATTAQSLSTPRDLAFHPERDELWVLNRLGSGAMAAGNTTIFFDPLSTVDFENYADTFAYHFMAQPSGLAFGAAEYEGSSEINFATCQESRNDYNGNYAPDDFMGPSLWPSDLEIYATVNQGWGSSLGGSHLDMLHQSPLCMGIAHDSANVYWVTDGSNGNIVRYDFAVDHGPGYDDHSDGVVRRYLDATFTRIEDVPGHLVLDAAAGWLYYADTGTGTVKRLDTQSGDSAGNLSAYGEMLDEYTRWAGATVETFASDLSAPSGIALHEGRLFVSDYDSGEIIAFDTSTGAELDRIQTSASGITGLDISSAGEIYFVDMDAEEVVRVVPGD
jgi:outer membrane protein assembly factor BamB